MKVDEENGKSEGMVNGRYQNIWRFSSNEFWKIVGCLVLAFTFGLGGVEIVRKGIGAKYKWKEEKHMFNYDEG